MSVHPVAWRVGGEWESLLDQASVRYEAVYPWGAQVTASGNRWDARAGVVDRAPVAFWQRSAGDVQSANGIVGVGPTPRQGTRLGVSRAWGRFAGDSASHPLAHAAVRGFGRASVDHQVGVSMGWTRRWW